MIEDYYVFPMGAVFEQSVNHARRPRWWLQIGAAATWLSAKKSRLPAMYGYREFVEAGGLMAYEADLGELGRRMADDVHEILNGTRPADIPIYQSTRFDLAINLKASALPALGESAGRHASRDVRAGCVDAQSQSGDRGIVRPHLLGLGDQHHQQVVG